MTVRERSDLAVWLLVRDIARAAGRSTIRREDLYRAERFHGHPWGCVRKATKAARALAIDYRFDAYLPQLSVLWGIVDPQPYEYWISLGFNMLSRCDGLVRLPGDSQGADREVEHAKKLGLPALSHHDDPKEWAHYVRAQHAYRQETDR